MAATLRPIPLKAPGKEVLAAPLGCEVLNSLLHGGFPFGLVTEVTGEAGAGKTQLVLQALLAVQLPHSLGGAEGSALYIYTEGGTPVQRLTQLWQTRYASTPSVSLDNIELLEDANNPEAFFRAVAALQARLKQQAPGRPPVRLVVIDSIASVFRDVGDGMQGQHLYARRADQLFYVSALLKRLSHEYGLAVVVTNQVRDDINAPDFTTSLGLPTAGGNRAGPLVSSGRQVQPSLGLAWTHCVNMRLFVGRHEAPEGTLRTLQVVLAPHLPCSFCCFEVAHDGIWGLVPVEDQPHGNRDDGE